MKREGEFQLTLNSSSLPGSRAQTYSLLWKGISQILSSKYPIFLPALYLDHIVTRCHLQTEHRRRRQCHCPQSQFEGPQHTWGRKPDSTSPKRRFIDLLPVEPWLLFLCFCGLICKILVSYQGLFRYAHSASMES